MNINSLKIQIQYILLIGVICATSPVQAQIGGLMNRGGVDADTQPAVKMDALSDDFEKTVLEIGLARHLLLKAQLSLAEALGVKEQADDIMSSAGVLSEGGAVQPQTVADIEQSVAVSKELAALLDNAAQSAGELDENAKAKFLEGKILFGQGLAAEAAQIAVLTRLIKEFDGARGQIRRNPLRLRELVVLSVPTAKLARLIPGDVREMRKTYALIQKVGESNQIDVEEIDIDEFLAEAE